METGNRASSTSSETAQERQTLTSVLYKLRCQWNADPDTMAGKRDDLLRLLRRVGTERLITGIERCCQEHISEFWPPLPVLSTYIPEARQQDKFIENDREQSRLGRLYREGSDEVLSASEAQAFLKTYQARLEQGRIDFEKFYKGFIADRTQRRKARA